jgi:hypothetical protein
MLTVSLGKEATAIKREVPLPLGGHQGWGFQRGWDGFTLFCVSLSRSFTDLDSSVGFSAGLW